MPKPKWNLNTTYISERLQESLRPISHCALTAVVAPMGYGKTTAVNWYLEERAKTEKPTVIRISVYSDNLTIFWKSAKEAFFRAGFDFLQDDACPTDAVGGGFLADDLCHALRGDAPCYIFIDDFHLLTDARAAEFLCALANRLPGNVHLIVASRDNFLPAAQVVRLGGRVYQIGVEQLRLNHTELSVYAHRCGTDLTDEQVDALLYSSEGWFSAVYLYLRTLSDSGALPDSFSDIYRTFTAAMIEPLPEDRREFLAVMGLADEVTVEMAAFVTENAQAAGLLTALSEQNAFVKHLPEKAAYRFHHMMKECAKRTFLTLSLKKQRRYQLRYGVWYENSGQYLHAMAAYRKSESYEELLRVVQKDAGILLSSLNPQAVTDGLAEIPLAVLKAYPLALLVLMRCMFNWRNIPKMMELRELFTASLAEHPELSERERGDLRGECDLILSFLYYNDIRAMSRLHRSAASQMSRTAVSIRKNGGWTFGSPSVLMMFYRAPGELESELAEMEECMPHYYRLTDGHGEGAEIIMRAEADFMRGHFTDAHIALESAYAKIEGNGQENMTLCCDFLSWRLSFYTALEQRYTLEKRYESLLWHHNAAWIQLWSSTAAYYEALRGRPEKIPAVFAEHQLSSVGILAPGKPMAEMIENQVYLAQGAYATVIGRSEKQLAVCEAMHYALVAIHVRIQTAAAYEMLGKTDKAREYLSRALEAAEPDEFLLPFAENYRYLKERLSETDSALAPRILAIGKQAEISVRKRPEAFAVLTEREFEIACLLAERQTGREIAQKLFLSEGSVKQYVNQIYSKLQIEGDTRTKRSRLFELFRSKT